MVFMVHPLHGANNVSQSEVVEQEKNGWAVSTHEEWLALKSKPALANSVEKTAVRRGRKPKVSNDNSESTD
jgi:hypothetical protein